MVERPERARPPVAARPTDSPQEAELLLVVDDEPSIRGLLASLLEGAGYRTVEAGNGARALALLEREPVGLVLTDLRMPVCDGMWLLKESRARFPEVPVLMLTGLDDTRTAVDCLREGAVDYLVKPVDVETVKLSVRRALDRRRLERENERYRRNLEGMVRDRTRDLRRLLDEREFSYGMTLEALVTALDARERDTTRHSLRVAIYTATLAREVGVTEADLIHVYRGALLHDIGKIGIPDAILLKPGKLTPEEWGVMRTHPEIGSRILEGIAFLEPCRDIVLHHHERWDGTGYPGGLRGEAIPIGARLFAVADSFDAMTTDRPYRQAMPLAEVEAELDRCAGGQFDPEVVAVYHRLVQEGWRPREERLPPLEGGEPAP